MLINKNGKVLTIDDIIIKRESATVYNFMVEDFHNYYVGNLAIWTHNKGQCDFDFSKKSYEKPSANKSTLWDIKKYAVDTAEANPKNVKLYKQPDGTWWSKDLDNHGTSGFKAHKEKGKEFHWVSDADPHGNYIPKDSKHKGESGKILRRK